MAYDVALADRVRDVVGGRTGFEEKQMFGGIAFLLEGNMCCGVLRDGLIVRLDPEAAAEALEQPDVREFDATGRPMKGWALVEPAALETEAELTRWVDEAADFAASLPPK